MDRSISWQESCSFLYNFIYRQLGVYIKKDVNKALLLLVLVPLLLFAWFSDYYYSNLKNITVELNKTQISGNAAIGSSLQKDREVLEKGYSELRSENELLRKENEKLKSESEASKSNFDKLYARFLEIQESLIKANDDLSRLSAKNKELCQRLKEKGGEC